MTNDSSKRNLLGLLPLLLFAVLAVAVLSVVFGGAKSYASVTARGNSSYTLRTATQYVSTKVKQSCGDIATGDFGSTKALSITETINGEEYITRIYCYDGYIYELFSSAKADMSPSDGERLLKIDSMDVSTENGLITVCFENKGSSSTIVLADRSYKEE